jgi:hypothetical protein
MQALEGAPDAINKARLERLLDLVRQPEVVELDPYTCAAACAVVCAEVAELPACYIPCIYACIQI